MWLLALKLIPWLGRLGPVATVLKTRWKLVLSGVLTIVLVFMYINIQSKGHKIDILQTEIQVAREANSSNQITIKSLRSANESLAKAVIVSDELRLEAEISAMHRELRAQIRLEDTITQLQDLEDESISCSEVMQIDLGAVCPLTVKRLREHAGTPDSN